MSSRRLRSIVRWRSRICEAPDALLFDVGKDLACRVWCRLIGSEHALKRLSVAQDRAEGLTELMCNGAGQRRHRLTAAGVSSEGEVPSAVQLGLLEASHIHRDTANPQGLSGGVILDATRGGDPSNLAAGKGYPDGALHCNCHHR